MNNEVKKFKEDYKNIKSRVKLIKKKLLDLKKEAATVSKDARNLYVRGDKTMYYEDKCRGLVPKFSGLDDMMEYLECFIYLDNVILRAIDDIP